MPFPAHERSATVLVAGEETRGAFALVETVEERGAEPPRHIHRHEDEALCVLEGSLDVWLASGWVEVPAGAAAFVPRGVEHAFVVASDSARVLSFFAPAGFEGFYREMGAVRSEVERLITTAARYGCEITGPAPARPETGVRPPHRRRAFPVATSRGRGKTAESKVVLDGSNRSSTDKHGRGQTMNETTTLPIERGETDRVSSAALVRHSGLLAIAAGASMILTPLVHPESPQSATWVPVHLLYFATVMIVLLVLVGIFARQLRRAGRLGVVGFLTAFVGTAMGLLEGREHLFSDDFGQGTPVGLWQLILAALVFSIGYILLGVAIFRAGVFPRGAGILLAVGGPIVAFSAPIGILAVIIVGHTLFGLGLAWAGYALWSDRELAKGWAHASRTRP